MGEDKRLEKLTAARDLAEQKYHLITAATIDAIIMITPDGKISWPLSKGLNFLIIVVSFAPYIKLIN